MTFGEDACDEVGVLFGIFTDAEECGFGIVFAKNVEHPRGYLFVGTVVEGKEYGIFILHIPDEGGEDAFYKFWWSKIHYITYV